MFDEMMVNTPRDLLIFISVFFCGICIGVVFDLFRALRRAYTPGSGMLAFQDAVFCAVAFFLFSHTVSRYADGDLRWYVFAGLILGLLLYFVTIGKYVLNIMAGVFSAVRKILQTVLLLLKRIFLYLSKPFMCIFKKVKKMVFSFADKKKGKSRKKQLKKKKVHMFWENFFKKIFTSVRK